MNQQDHQVTYLLIDGENIDATLGTQILGRRPSADERPRWDRLLDFAQGIWGSPANGLFFINASSGELPMPFIQFLLAVNYQPIPLSGPRDVKVVDVGIQRTLEAIATRPGNVLLGSHDGEFVPQIERLIDQDRNVGVIALREYLSLAFQDLVPEGLQIFDLEDDADAFNIALPRTRIIDLDDFNPEPFLRLRQR